MQVFYMGYALLFIVAVIAVELRLLRHKKPWLLAADDFLACLGLVAQLVQLAYHARIATISLR